MTLKEKLQNELDKHQKVIHLNDWIKLKDLLDEVDKNCCEITDLKCKNTGLRNEVYLIKNMPFWIKVKFILKKHEE